MPLVHDEYRQSEMLEGHDRSIPTKVNHARLFRNKNDGVHPEQRGTLAVPKNPVYRQGTGSDLRKPEAIKMAVAKVNFLAASDCRCLLLPGNHIFLNGDRDTTIAIKLHGKGALTLSHAAQVGRIAKGLS